MMVRIYIQQRPIAMHAQPGYGRDVLTLQYKSSSVLLPASAILGPLWTNDRCLDVQSAERSAGRSWVVLDGRGIRVPVRVCCQWFEPLETGNLPDLQLSGTVILGDQTEELGAALEVGIYDVCDVGPVGSRMAIHSDDMNMRASVGGLTRDVNAARIERLIRLAHDADISHQHLVILNVPILVRVEVIIDTAEKSPNCGIAEGV